LQQLSGCRQQQQARIEQEDVNATNSNEFKTITRPLFYVEEKRLIATMTARKVFFISTPPCC